MNASILVAGGGPAGLCAAIAAASHGLDVLLVDEAPKPGGQLAYRIADDAQTVRVRLVAEALAAGVTIESRSVAWGLFSGDEATVSSGGASRRVHFERAILATGSTDRVVSFSGSSLPGVFTTRALQILMHRHRVLPGRRAAVIGHDVDEICRDIELSGGIVVVRDSGDHPDRLMASGSNGVERLSVAAAETAVDMVVLALGKIPDSRLAIMADCAVTPSSGGFAPVRDATLRTTNPAIYAAGEIAGVSNIAVARAEGRLAGLAAAVSLGRAAEADLAREQHRFETEAPWRVLPTDSAKYVQFAGQEQWR